MKQIKLFLNHLFIYYATALVLSISFFIDLLPNHNFSQAYQTTTISYAKVGKDCALYKTSTLTNSVANIYFYIPPTYFVTILSKVSDEIFKVQYDNFIGYCNASKLSVVSFEPNTATLKNVTFDIASSAGTQIWSLPSDTDGQIYTTIPAETKNIEYIASAIGQIPIGGTIDLWYYARYTPSNNSTAVYEGYIYSEATTNLLNIPTNLEEEPILNNNTPSNTTINQTLKIVLIVLICLPFVTLFVITLIKTTKKIKDTKQTKVKKEEPQPTNTITSNSFIKKPKRKIVAPDDDLDTVEVVFPEYNFIDDDDLL